LFGLIAALALATFAVIQISAQSQTRQPTAVLRATRDILPGTTIGAAELAVTQVQPSDASLLSTWVASGDRDRILGQVAVVGVPAGHLIPAEIVAPKITAELWKANVPIKRSPANLKAGDHVALLVQGTSQGQATEFVFMQDVQVLSVGSGAVDLWLPAQASAPSRVVRRPRRDHPAPDAAGGGAARNPRGRGRLRRSPWRQEGL